MTYVPGFGPATARYAIVGEAPGAEERRRGVPFVGPSGQLLREALERVGLDPDEAYITNVYKEYRYGNPTPTPAEIAEARADLFDELSAMPDIKAVLALGNVPLRAFTGRSGITKNRGLQEALEPIAIPVFTTLHPAAILRNVRYKSDWLNDIAGFAALINETVEDVDVRRLRTPQDLAELRQAAEAAEWVGALDVETTIGDMFNDGMQMVCIGVSFDGKTSWVVTPDDPIYHQALIVLSKGKWIMHNGSFDLLALNVLTPVAGWQLHQDTMAMAYLLHPEERKGLQLLTGVYLGLPPYKDVDYKNILDEPIEKVAAMNGRDVARTYQLFRPLADELNDKPHLSRTYQWLLLPAITALVGITLNGVPVDRERLKVLEDELSTELAEELVNLRTLVGEPDPELYGKEKWAGGAFNPGSPQQVRHVLFDLHDYPIVKYTKKDGKETDTPSTDREVLEKLFDQTGDELLEALLHYRKASKLLTASVNPWNTLMDEKGRLHPKYKPTQVVTGRLAAELPNIQQVPRDPRFRSVFGGVPGFTWVKADLSQIELRLAGWLADEPTMLEAYRQNQDLHAITAQRVLGVEDVTVSWKPGKSARDAGKVLNFSLLYGAYPTKLREIARSQYGVTLTKQEAERYRGIFFDTYPRLAEWHSEVKSELHATGMVASPLGRVRSFPEITDPDEWVVKAAEREAINHPVQSFASDLVLYALTALPDWIRQYAIIELHDELDFLIPNSKVEAAIPIIQATMQDVTWLQKWGIDLDVPVLAEVTHGPYWSNK